MTTQNDGSRQGVDESAMKDPGRYTPENITSLKPTEIFVFGSNIAGRHAAGAAALAVDKFGAIEGHGEGLQGQSYAIPTMEGLDSLKAAVFRFMLFAVQNPSKTFLVTKIGCGIAGHKPEDVAPFFAGHPANVILPEDFAKHVPVTITTYKAFDKHWKCRDFQYRVGETYTHTGAVKACGTGFHACEYPLDVLRYYPPASSKFAIVKQSGKLDRHHEDSKVASEKIKICAEVELRGLIEAAVQYTTARCKPVDHDSPAQASGDGGAAQASGYGGAAQASGQHSSALASGYGGKVMGNIAGIALFLAERNDNNEIIAVWSGITGRDGIKAGTWYTLRNGLPCEVSNG